MQEKQARQNSWKRVVVGVTLSLGLLLGGCRARAASQPDDQVEIPTLTIKAKDFSFEVPQQVEAGLVTIKLENDGQETHHAQLLRLNEGVTFEQFGVALQQGPIAVLTYTTLMGGPGPVNAGGEQRVTVELTPGQYVLVCFLEGKDGVPHVAKGMIVPFEVVESQASDAMVAQAPQVDGEVKLVEFSFILPPTIPAGAQTWKVTTAGKQPHEMVLLKLEEGKTMADAQQWLDKPEGAQPFSYAGGMQAIHPGAVGYLHLDLTPGNYVAVCFVPDPATGQPHMHLGMMIPFHVS